MINLRTSANESDNRQVIEQKIGGGGGRGCTASAVFGLVTKIGEPRQTFPKRGTKATIKDNRTPV